METRFGTFWTEKKMVVINFLKPTGSYYTYHQV